MKDGFADLRSPADLVRKLERDRRRMDADAMDTDAAFNFFVTAEHVLDWISPDEPGKSRKKEREAKRASERLLQIVSHIANGAKHFRATASHHSSVQDVETRPGAFSPSAFSTSAFSPSASAFAGLHVQLEDGSLVHAFDLADQVLAYWKRELQI